MKKTISIVLAISLVFSLFIGLSINLQASTEIETRIQTIKNKYPSGSYFSANGKACSGVSSNHGCSNCSLSNIDTEAYNACGEGCSCWAFANYVFYHVFKTAPSNSSNTYKDCGVGALNDNAKYGDYIICYNSAKIAIHYFIYLGGSGQVNCYRYESNVGDNPNVVNIENRAQSAGGITSFRIIHAYNYDSLNKDSLGKATNLQVAVRGGALTLSWNAASGANCYDVIVTKPDGSQSWYHASGTSKTFTDFSYGTYKFDVQSLYRPNGSSTGQTVGPHSDVLTYNFTMQSPTNVTVTQDGSTLTVTWDAADGANCYDVIVKNPLGSTNWYHSVGTSKVLTDCIAGRYTIDVQSLYRPNGTSEGQVVGPHSGEVTFNCVDRPDGEERVVSDGIYHIVSALSSKSGIDVAGNGSDNGTNIQLYENVTDNNQLFRVQYYEDGYYIFTHLSTGKVMEVAGWSVEQGANVQTYSLADDVPTQKWVVTESGDSSSFYIQSLYSGLYLDVLGGKTANGTNIQIYAGNGTDSQKWRFVPYTGNDSKTVPNGDYYIVPRTNKNMCISIDGDESAEQINVALANNNYSSPQVYNLSYLNNGCYKITNTKTGKVLDLYCGYSSQGTNVTLYASNDTDPQQWMIRKTDSGYYNILSKKNALHIGINDENNVCGYAGSGLATQEWKFVCVNHTYSSQPETVASTCTEQGYTLYRCTVCGETMKSDYVPALGHLYSVVSVERGMADLQCATCGDEYFEEFSIDFSEYNEMYDANNDGYVNVRDYSIFKKQ